MRAQFSDSLAVLAGAVDDWYTAQQLLASNPPMFATVDEGFLYSEALSDMLRAQVASLTKIRQFRDAP